jgi:anti-sigma B factor antagonist
MHVSVIGNPDDTVVVTVRGDLDFDSATALGTALDRVLDRPAPRVVVDVSGVAFCDSTGLSSFVLGHLRARAAGGWLRVAAPSEWLLRMLETVGLTPQVEVYPSVADALSTDPDL